MKAIIYHAYDDIRLENVPVPTCADDELVIRVHGCGLCGSDILKIVQKAPAPVKLGHELTGTIVECGARIEDFEVGQRVVVAHHVPCGICHYCRRGNHSMCASFKSSNIDPCGFAEYVRVPAPHVRRTTLALPDFLSAEEGSFVEPLACCVRAYLRTPVLDGDRVAVVGLGSIGLLMVQAVKGMAIREGKTVHISGIDLLPERLKLAQELGADAIFMASEDEQALRGALTEYVGERGVDAVIVTAPGGRAFSTALACVRKGGTINLFAAHTGKVPVDLEQLYQHELTVRSTYSSSPQELRYAHELLSLRLVHADRLISHRLPLERFSEGVALMRERAALKVYFTILDQDTMDK